MKLKPWLRHLDVASRHAYCMRNLRANFLHRLTWCYVS